MTRHSWRAASACEIGQVFVSVVSDGAGSAKHSEIGSWLASSTFIELVELYFDKGGRLVDIDRDRVASWIAGTAERLIDRARDDGNDPKDYSCTLIAAIIGPNAAVFAQIGDGAVVVSHGEADGWSWVFWPQHGEYANQTTFVLSENALASLEFGLAPRRIDEFAMFSDGIERMVLHGATKAVNDAFFEQMFIPVRASNARGLDEALSEKLRQYLGSAAVNARTNDDKSLLLATRRPRAKASS
jgi:hypothetical protein